MAAKAKRAPKKKGGYQMPEPIQTGEILTDISKHQWILGKSIGIGGFGEVYSAAPYSGKIPKNYPNVIKIEPHGNGPLFVEMHFYMRNCKSDEIDSWLKKKKLTTLGMPRYVASGSHEYKNIKYRFLVIDRYGRDLWKIFEENNRQFPEHIVYKLALQIVDILEYIHHKNYVHADIKGENLLLDLNSYDQVYLVDFGLASRCTTSTELKVDPKRAHNGTLQYTSRDAHMGVPTRRGDIEILNYNIILWLCGSLPWEKLLDKVTVQKEKEKAFDNIDNFLNKCFHGSVPQAVHKFMTLLATIKFNEIPSYEKFKEILIAGLKKLNHKSDGKLRLNSIDTSINISISTPRKIQKVINKVRKSPRMKQIDSSTRTKNIDTSNPHTKHIDISSPVINSRKSTIGVIMDKKRCNLKDIEKALDDMDSDGEYDIQILKKAKKTVSNDKISKVTEDTIPLHIRKKIQINNEESSDNECDTRISKKAKKTETNNRVSKMEDTVPLHSRKKIQIDYENDSEDEFKMKPLLKRPNRTRQKMPAQSKTRRKMKSLDDSESTSESEVVLKGTKSRPTKTATRDKVTVANRKLQSNKPIIKTNTETQSDEDIFDSSSNN